MEVKPKEYKHKMKLMEELHSRGYRTSVSSGGIEVRRVCAGTAAVHGGCGYQIDWKANYEYPHKDVTADRIDEDFIEFRTNLDKLFPDMDIYMYVGQIRL
jgi:hypothetical protein